MRSKSYKSVVRCLTFFAVASIVVGLKSPRVLADTANGGEHHKHVYIVYFNPADRDCVPGYEGRIERVLTEVQNWYRSEMERNGFGPIVFPFERDEDGKLVIHVVKGTRSYAPGEEITTKHVRDVQVKPAMAKRGIDIDNEHIIIFQNLCFIEGTKIRAWCAYRGGGSIKDGTAWVTDNHFIEPANLSKSEPIVDDSGRIVELFGYVSSQIGGVAHEFGHALGLPHNAEMPDEKKTLGWTLMGGGNHRFLYERTPRATNGAFLSKAHATILAAHPLFKGHAKDVNVDPEVVFKDVRFACDGKKTTITGQVETNLKPYAIVAYNNEMFVGTDYDATSWITTDIGPRGKFRVEMHDVRVGPFEVSLKCYLENGWRDELVFRYQVDETFKIPTEYLFRQYLYEQFVKPAHEKRDPAGVLAGMKKLEEKNDQWYRKAKGIYRILTEKPKPLTPFGDIGEDAKEVLLSSMQWESAKVGWDVPAVDHVPGGLLPFESRTKIFDHGIYAHADSSYVYNIGGKWRYFTFGYCLQNWGPGSVVFVVKCDGVEKFRSGRMDEWDAKSAKVDIRGVKTLELIVEDADDGRWADCGNWLEPRLTR